MLTFIKSVSRICLAVANLLLVSCVPMISSTPTIMAASITEPVMTVTPPLSATPHLPATPTPPDASPIEISTPVSLLAKGLGYSMASQENGDVLAWGNSSILGLSTDRTDARIFPESLQGVQNVKAIYPGDLFALFVTTTGELYELSYNERGSYNLIPGITEVEQAAAGSENVAAIRSDGSVWVRGKGDKGQFGTGDLNASRDFVRVPLDDITQILLIRNLAVALRKDGSLWVWGTDKYITGVDVLWSTPHKIAEVQNAASVTWGDGLSILHRDGSVTVWVGGQFHQVEELPVSLTQIDGATRYTLGLGNDGSVWVWGQGWDLAMYPQPAEAIFTSEAGRFEAHQIEMKNIVQVSAGGTANLALDKEGSVWFWGINISGESGTGEVDSFVIEPTPIIVVRQ